MDQINIRAQGLIVGANSISGQRHIMGCGNRSMIWVKLISSVSANLGEVGKCKQLRDLRSDSIRNLELSDFPWKIINECSAPDKQNVNL